MQALSSPDLLDVWERGRTQPPERQALLLLAAAWPETSLDVLAELRLGQRDARLLALREAIFGPHLASVTQCPACGERLELAFDVADILVEPSGDTIPEGEQGMLLAQDGYEVRFRAPNSRDLAAVTTPEAAPASRASLLARCILEARQEGEPLTIEALPDGVLAAVMDRMAEADPQANVDLDLCCPACEHRWLGVFDIASFFWSELETWAGRLLTEVHHVASAYGWREADILAMSPWRRRTYLEMIRYG
jgi:hypothetical protein